MGEILIGRIRGESNAPTEEHHIPSFDTDTVLCEVLIAQIHLFLSLIVSCLMLMLLFKQMIQNNVLVTLDNSTPRCEHFSRDYFLLKK